MFTVVAMESADDHDRRGKEAIGGEYATSGGGTCLYSLGGFNLGYTPIGTSWPGVGMATGP